MAEEITVVKVTRERLGPTTCSWRVHFSAPVQLRDIGEEKEWWCESAATDELGAFVWGLEVIKKHKERARG